MTRTHFQERPLVIYGVAFLSVCLIAGLFLGDLLGALMGVQANVGGVGIAMILMILLSDRFRRAGRLSPLTEQGVLFWSSIYIPIVVAMAARQNVVGAVEGGPAAILAGTGAVVVCFLLVPVLSRVGSGGVAAEAEKGGGLSAGAKRAGGVTGEAERAGGVSFEARKPGAGHEDGHDPEAGS